jgi:hypothetical protein
MTGENEQQEIVLGNKQLLSIFFLVVAMMGVAFTIGYIIGRNTAGVSAAGSGQTASAPPPAATTPPAPVQENPAPAGDSPKADDNKPPAVDQTGGTQPAKPYETAVPKTSPKEEPAAGASGATPAPNAAPAAAIAAGSYLQVAAVKRQDGDHLVEVLRKRGFPALLGESPKEGLFRVLVGPFPDMASLADSKQKLRAAGFEPVVAK